MFLACLAVLLCGSNPVPLMLGALGRNGGVLVGRPLGVGACLCRVLCGLSAGQLRDTPRAFPAQGMR